MCLVERDCHDDDVTFTTHIESARFHDADAAPCGGGARAIEDYLQSHIGNDYTVVEVSRPEGCFSLIVDANWFRLAQQASRSQTDVLGDLELPRSSLLAVVVGWSSDWVTASADLSVEYSTDHIPHLRLTSLRPSPSGADGNASRS